MFQAAWKFAGKDPAAFFRYSRIYFVNMNRQKSSNRDGGTLPNVLFYREELIGLGGKPGMLNGFAIGISKSVSVPGFTNRIIRYLGQYRKTISIKHDIFQSGTRLKNDLCKIPII